MKSIKVLSIKEPHASLLLTPYKTIETRSWATKYRGEIYLQASKAIPSYKGNPIMWERVYALLDKYAVSLGRRHWISVWPNRGKIYAKATLVDCIEMTEENIAALPQEEIDAGYYTPGRYMWVLKDITPIDPIPANGRLGIWNYETEE